MKIGSLGDRRTHDQIKVREESAIRDAGYATPLASVATNEGCVGLPKRPCDSGAPPTVGDRILGRRVPAASIYTLQMETKCTHWALDTPPTYLVLLPTFVRVKNALHSIATISSRLRLQYNAASQQGL